MSTHYPYCFDPGAVLREVRLHTPATTPPPAGSNRRVLFRGRSVTLLPHPVNTIPSNFIAFLRNTLDSSRYARYRIQHERIRESQSVAVSAQTDN